MCFSPQQLSVVDLYTPNLNQDLIHIFKLKMGNFSCLCSRGSHAVPYLTYHNLNQIACSQLAALTMWPSSYQKVPPFEIGLGFSHGSSPESSAVCVCVFENVREKSPTPLPFSPASVSYKLSTIPPFSPFFHHLPSFETQYHTLDSLCCHGEEHSFLWHGHTECVNAGGSLKKKKTWMRN